MRQNVWQRFALSGGKGVFAPFAESQVYHVNGLARFAEKKLINGIYHFLGSRQDTVSV